MDVARQVVRWSIPAAVCVLVFLLGELWLAVIFEQPMVREVGLEVNSAATLLAVVLGLALGFLLYQVYFYALDSVLPWLPRVVGVPPDRGRDVLIALEPDQIDWVRATLKLPIRLNDMLAPRRLHPIAGVRLPRDSVRRRLVYRRRRDDNWRVVRRLIFDYLASDEVAWAEHQSTNDIYHSLGTCRIATLLAAASSVLYNLRVHSQSLAPLTWAKGAQWGVAAFGLLVLFGAVYFLLGRARRGTAMTLQHDLIDALRAKVPSGVPLEPGAEPAHTANGRPGLRRLKRATRAVHPLWWTYR